MFFETAGDTRLVLNVLLPVTISGAVADPLPIPGAGAGKNTTC